MQIETLPEHKRSKKYGEFEVDFELKNSWLDRLNKIVAVSSVCSGHPDGMGALGAGGFCPCFIFRVYNWDEADELFEKLSNSPNTKIEWIVWGGLNDMDILRQVISHADGKQKVSAVTQEEVNESDIKHHMISVKSGVRHNGRNGDRRARWWRSAIKLVEQFYDNRG